MILAFLKTCYQFYQDWVAGSRIRRRRMNMMVSRRGTSAGGSEFNTSPPSRTSPTADESSPPSRTSTTETLARKTGAQCSQVRRRKVKKGSYCYLSSFLFAPLTAVNCHKSTLGLWRQLDSPKIQVRLRNDPPSSETVNHSSMNIERSTIYFTHLFEPNQIFYFCRLFPHFADLFWMPIVYFMNNKND